jgi:Tol biopolymer transport system component
LYVSANAGGHFHIWRQRYPNGTPEQVTSGPTEEEGIAMAADGKSFITSVGTSDSSIWIHHPTGDRQLTSEGDTFSPTFSSDGTRLYYLKRDASTGDGELWYTQLAGGHTERLLPGYEVEGGLFQSNYAVSADGSRIAAAIRDEKGVSHIWVADAGRRSSPQQLTSQESEDTPFFLPNGDLIYRASQAGKNFIYTRKQDGAAARKIADDVILEMQSPSPDGKWVIAARGRSKDQDHPYQVLAYPIGSGTPVLLCQTLCWPQWDANGAHVFFTSIDSRDTNTYFVPTESGRALPKLPGNGITAGQELRAIKGTQVIPRGVASAMSPDVYAYSRTNIRRNLYRIPIQ